MRVRRFASTILATARPLLTETRADLGALASTTAGAQVDNPMIVARIARSWTGAPLFFARFVSWLADSQPASLYTSAILRIDLAALTPAVVPPIGPRVPPEFAAMSREALHRILSGHIAVLGARQGV
jgi:hypothetical protein